MLVYTFKLNDGHAFSVLLPVMHYSEAVHSLCQYVEPIDLRQCRGAILWQGHYTETLQMLERVEFRPKLNTALVEGMQFMREVYNEPRPLTLDWLRANVQCSQFYMEISVEEGVFDITPHGFIRKVPERKSWKREASSSLLKGLTGLENLRFVKP